jgi:hypothetical protein
MGLYTVAGYRTLCECCSRPLIESDLEDGETLSAECCGRVAMCADCREPGEHECDDPPTPQIED